jgi:hypothetical protein
LGHLFDISPSTKGLISGTSDYYHIYVGIFVQLLGSLSQFLAELSAESVSSFRPIKRQHTHLTVTFYKYYSLISHCYLTDLPFHFPA